MCHTGATGRTLSDSAGNGQKINGKVSSMSANARVICVGIVYPIKYLSLPLHHLRALNQMAYRQCLHVYSLYQRNFFVPCVNRTHTAEIDKRGLYEMLFMFPQIIIIIIIIKSISLAIKTFFVLLKMNLIIHSCSNFRNFSMINVLFDVYQSAKQSNSDFRTESICVLD